MTEEKDDAALDAQWKHVAVYLMGDRIAAMTPAQAHELAMVEAFARNGPAEAPANIVSSEWARVGGDIDLILVNGVQYQRVATDKASEENSQSIQNVPPELKTHQSFDDVDVIGINGRTFIAADAKRPVEGRELKLLRAARNMFMSNRISPARIEALRVAINEYAPGRESDRKDESVSNTGNASRPEVGSDASGASLREVAANEADGALDVARRDPGPRQLRDVPRREVAASSEESAWPWYGTCVDCPTENGIKRPWECKYRERYDHRLGDGLRRAAPPEPGDYFRPGSPIATSSPTTSSSPNAGQAMVGSNTSDIIAKLCAREDHDRVGVLHRGHVYNVSGIVEDESGEWALLETGAETLASIDETKVAADRPGQAVLVIDMQTPRAKQRGGHAHGCPVCHENVPCEDECSIEPDLAVDITPRGAYVTCANCVAKAAGRASPAKCMRCGDTCQLVMCNGCRLEILEDVGVLGEELCPECRDPLPEPYPLPPFDHRAVGAGGGDDEGYTAPEVRAASDALGDIEYAATWADTKVGEYTNRERATKGHQRVFVVALGKLITEVRRKERERASAPSSSASDSAKLARIRQVINWTPITGDHRDRQVREIIAVLDGSADGSSAAGNEQKGKETT